MVYCPPHLISVPVLPWKTESTDIMSFHLNVVRCFANRHTKTHQNYHLTIHRLPSIRKTIDCIGIRQITQRLPGAKHPAICYVRSQQSPCLPWHWASCQLWEFFRRIWKVSVTIDKIFSHIMLTGTKHAANDTFIF